MSDIDATALARWIGVYLPDAGDGLRVTKFAGGQSNPTYRIDTDAGRYVLRRKPFGQLLPSAHAIEREYRLLSALRDSPVPVPRPIALCEDRGVIGAAFYLMEMIEGRTFWDGTLPELDRDARRTVYERLIDTMADLHRLDHVALGLEDFGRGGNYFARQIERWTRQYRSSQTDDIPEIEQLIDWLPRTVPDQKRSAIIHGDYRIDNLLFAPDGGTILAVLDWELATIGDPLADFAYLAMNWVLPPDGAAALGGLDVDALGIPSLDDVIARYCARTERDDLPDLRWYFAYNLFRAAGIIQGIKRRMLDGNASSAQAETAVAKLVPVAQAAWTQAQLAQAS